MRTELIVPPTDATTQIRPVPEYRRCTLYASTHLNRQLLPLRPAMPSATLDHFLTPCSLISRRSIMSSCIYVHAHNLAVTSNHSELKYDAGFLGCALAMYVPLVAKGPTFPSCRPLRIDPQVKIGFAVKSLNTRRSLSSYSNCLSKESAARKPSSIAPNASCEIRSNTLKQFEQAHSTVSRCWKP